VVVGLAVQLRPGLEHLLNGRPRGALLGIGIGKERGHEVGGLARLVRRQPAVTAEQRVEAAGVGGRKRVGGDITLQEGHFASPAELVKDDLAVLGLGKPGGQQQASPI